MKKYFYLLFIALSLSSATVIAQCGVQLSITDSISCYGSCDGIIEAKATGVAPFTYDWGFGGTSDSVTTDLCGFKYYVTITDDIGCSATDSVDLIEPGELIALPTITNITCYGACDGTILLNVTGGTPGYSYLWSNGSTATTKDITNLCSISPCIHIEDGHGCAYDDCNFFISEPDSLTLDIQSLTGGTLIFCNGNKDGSVLATAGGGSSPYSYDWSTGDTVELVNNLGAGTYVLTITDINGCEKTDSITYTEPDPYHVTYSTSGYFGGYEISCNGALDGSICASVSGQTQPYYFTWSPSGGTDSCETGLSAGYYCVNIMDANGCTLDSCFTLTEPDALLDYPIPVDPTCMGCADGEITFLVTGGVPPYTYLWTPNSSETDSAATGLIADTYFVCATDLNGCSVCETISLTDPLSVLKSDLNLSATIFPNPSTGKFNLIFRTSITNASVNIINPLGQIVYADLFTGTAGTRKEINLDAPAGIYFVQITAERSKWVGKILKE